MSATNKTPNMELPIYVAEDKPTYLGDWNSTMSKIDTTVTAARNVADSAMETASNASNGVATNTESIGALQTDVQLVKSNQTAINDHLTDIDNSITVLNAKATKTTSQLNSGDIAFQFGVDAEGNYGYIKAGADTVTPFLKKIGIGDFYKQAPVNLQKNEALPKTELTLDLEVGHYIVLAFVSNYTSETNNADIVINVTNGTYTKKSSNSIYENGSGTQTEPTCFLLDVEANEGCSVNLNTNVTNVLGCFLKAWKVG